MPPKSSVPIRICGSKTRTGCKTCKQRHLKCDERQPICLRCLKADRPCVYEQSLSQTPQQTTSAAREAGSAALTLPQHRGYFRSPSPHGNVSLYGTRDVREVSAVKNFIANLGKELAGCFSDNVWCSILPRVAQYEPSIWHAIVAISILDTSARRRDSSDDVSTDANMALRQYSKAMQELNNRLAFAESVYRKDVVLLCCALFAVFECLQDNYVSALRHISGGTKLLMEWTHEAQSRGDNGAGEYLDYTYLQPIFLSLDSQAVQVGIVDFREHLSLPAIGGFMQIPTSFSTIEEAHLSLNHIFNRLSRWAVWVEPSTGSGTKPDDGWMREEGQRLKAQLETWKLAFDAPLRLAQPQPATVLLLVQRRVVQAFFNKHIDGPSEMEWDKSLWLFQEAIEYAETYLALTNNDYHTQSPGTKFRDDRSRPVFTVAMGIVMSLFLISAKCRDSRTRRRALTMLKTCGCKEGIWDSFLSSVLAEKVINVEEAATTEDGHIHENARVYETDIRMGEDRRGKIVLRRLVRGEDGYHRIETIEDDIAW